MIKNLHSKKYYVKPSIKLEDLDYCISLAGTSPPPDPPGMMKKPAGTPSSTKTESPFGGTKPKYK